jgi:hypothetical protein
MNDQQLMDRIKALGAGAYRDVRMLDDGTIVGIGELMFTRAIYMDMNLNGWGRRFCFDDRPLADEQYQQIVSGDQEPTGWIARR